MVTESDLVVTSSELLLRRRPGPCPGFACSSAMLANTSIFQGRLPRGREAGSQPRIGYYGAIAEWFDGGLVAELAGLRPAWRFELIGSTLAGNVRPLEDLPNVRLLGERPYGELPRWIGKWDAFIIPFKRVLLTEATNPVKVYEMLATGKPVVAVRLPELVPIAAEGLIRLGDTAEQFAIALETELHAHGSGARGATPGFRPGEYLARSIRRSGRRDRPDSPPMRPGRRLTRQNHRASCPREPD